MAEPGPAPGDPAWLPVACAELLAASPSSTRLDDLCSLVTRALGDACAVVATSDHGHWRVVGHAGADPVPAHVVSALGERWASLQAGRAGSVDGWSYVPVRADGALHGALVLDADLAGDDRRRRALSVIAGTAGQLLLVDRLRTDRAAVLSSELLTEQRNRRRIADRLHDGPQQILVSLGIRMQLLQDQVPEPLVPELRAVASQAEAARQELRGMILDLDTLTGHDVLTNALRTLLDSNADAAGWRTRFDAGPGVDEVGEEIQLTVERVVQEALANARLHAGASEVSVALSRLDDLLVVDVLDDGVGIPGDLRVDQDDRGLRAMHERIRVVGGSLLVARRPSGGTSLTVRVPVSSATPAQPQDTVSGASSGR